MKCQAKSASGRACTKLAKHGKYCHLHDPKLANYRKEIAIKARAVRTKNQNSLVSDTRETKADAYRAGKRIKAVSNVINETPSAVQMEALEQALESLVRTMIRSKLRAMLEQE